MKTLSNKVKEIILYRSECYEGNKPGTEMEENRKDILREAKGHSSAKT